MRRLVLALGLSLFGLSLFPFAAQADCPSVRWNFSFGQETATRRETDGAPCRFRMTDVGGDRAVYGVEIPVAPKYGSATAAGRATVVYRPRPGFKGEDSFVFELVGKMNGNPTSARVRVTVTVK